MVYGVEGGGGGWRVVCGGCRVEAAYQPALLKPLPQAVGGAVADLTAQVVSLLAVHQLQSGAQILQQVERSHSPQERGRGGLTVKQTVRVVHGLRA